MSRTWRQKEGVKYQNGRINRDIPHICRCDSCTGVIRRHSKEKVVDREMKLQLKEWYCEEY